MRTYCGPSPPLLSHNRGEFSREFGKETKKFPAPHTPSQRAEGFFILPILVIFPILPQLSLSYFARPLRKCLGMSQIDLDQEKLFLYVPTQRSIPLSSYPFFGKIEKKHK